MGLNSDKTSEVFCINTNKNSWNVLNHSTPYYAYKPFLASSQHLETRYRPQRSGRTI